MWEDIFKEEFNKDYYQRLEGLVETERRLGNVYPLKKDVFKAFELTPFKEVKVVIIGQDPYHQKNQAHGLAFSSLANLTPKSLLNIKKELYNDLKISVTNNNNLTNWALQGVLLINTILTVNESKPLSHKNFGWEKFTLNIIKKLCDEKRPIIFVLWGNNAIKYEKHVYRDEHLIIKSSHPSPLSAYRSFLGSKPFSKINNFLIKHNLKEINFKI